MTEFPESSAFTAALEWHRAGKSSARSAQSVKHVDAILAELDAQRATLDDVRRIAREERDARFAVLEEIRQAARIGQHLPADGAVDWPRWQLANRALDGALRQLALEDAAT